MIKVNFKKSNGNTYEVVIKGHANYAEMGQDIVCSAVSTMAITTVNAILSLEETIDASEKSGYLVIRTLKDTDVNQKLLSNLERMLTELSEEYPQNIEIRNED